MGLQLSQGQGLGSRVPLVISNSSQYTDSSSWWVITLGIGMGMGMGIGLGTWIGIGMGIGIGMRIHVKCG